MTHTSVPDVDSAKSQDSATTFVFSGRKSDEEQAAFENATMYDFDNNASCLLIHNLFFRRRIDICVLPLLSLLYAVAVVDRTNISVARLVGMGKDLVCQSMPWSVVLTY
jgi:hypothetical protein